MTPWYDAGYCGGAAGPSLPTAATSAIPRARSAATARASVRLAGPTRLMLITDGFLEAAQASARTIAVAEPAAAIAAIDVADEQLGAARRAVKGTLLADQQRADGGAVAGRLGRAVETALLDPGAGQRGVRGNAAVDHRDARAGPDRRGGKRSRGGWKQRSTRRLIDMIKVGLERGRGPAQRLQPFANVHLSREGEGYHADAQIPGLLVPQDSETRALGKRKRRGIGIGNDQFALAHRLAFAVAVERVAIGADQGGEARLADVRQKCWCCRDLWKRPG